MSVNFVRIIPLGGVGEIGKNSTAIEYGDDLIVVDAGLKFPDADMPGIDLVIPDITYLREQAAHLRGILVTHGHEDHIGALPYYLSELDVPVYAPRLAHGLIAAKLREHRLADRVRLEVIEPGKPFRLGCFEVFPFHVTHSIPDSVGYAIQTPVGTIVHTGDFKFDETPVHGPPPDFQTIAEIGRRGVLALLSDCTRIEKAGRTPSERLVGETLDAIVRERRGRVIITTFASNISRVQQVIDVASRYERQVALVGRSMAQNCSVAIDLGVLKAKDSTLVRIEDLRKVAPEQTMLITTGSQGEPSSALSRISNGDHRQIRITPGDTVIISATPVPGNEESVARTIDNLLRLGAEVIYEPLATVHVSGHGSRDELRRMLELVQPRYCVPVHGEYRHMVLYRKMAVESGISPENVVLLDIGDVLEVGPESCRRGDEKVASGSMLVDGITIGSTTDVVLRDRQHLSRDGVMIVVVTMDRATGKLLAGPDIVTRGFPQPQGDGELFDLTRLRVLDAVEKHATGLDHGYLIHKIKDAVADSVYRQTRCHPLILPVVTAI